MADKEEKAVSFLDEVAGQGYENVGAGDTTTPLLLIAQQLSGAVDAGTVEVGHFYNSVTGEDYGTELDLVICHYGKRWYEWLPEQKGLAGIHEVGGIEVTGDVYSGMMHGENKVEEKMVFLVVLPDHPDAGYMIFSSTPGSMKFMKAWLTQAQNLRLPSGARAPLFGAKWHVTLNKITSKSNNKYYAPATPDGKSSFTFAEWIPQMLYEDQVKPAREIATQALALADTRSEQQAIEGPQPEF